MFRVQASSPIHSDQEQCQLSLPSKRMLRDKAPQPGYVRRSVLHRHCEETEYETAAMTEIRI
jgi:hypothetical protein